MVVTLYTISIGSLAIFAYKTHRIIALLCVLMLIVIPPIYILSTFGNNVLNPYGIDAIGRYLLVIHSVLPVSVAVLTYKLKTGVSGLMIGILVLCNITGLAVTKTTKAFDSPYYHRTPENLNLVITYLIEHNYLYVWTDVGLAQPLMFLSGEKILAADYHDKVMGGILRFPNTFEVMMDAPETVFLVPIIPGQTDTPLGRALDREQIDYEVKDFGSAALYIPLQRVDPQSVLDGLGPQY